MNHAFASRAAAAALALAAALASGSASAMSAKNTPAQSGQVSVSSIKITSVTPSTGTLPTSGAGVAIAFDYKLGGASDGQVSAFLKAQPAPGSGQTGLAPSFSPVWLTAGSTGAGHASISLAGYCQDSTVPTGTVYEVSVVLSKSGHFSGPIGPELAKDARPVQFSYACPGVKLGPSPGRGRLPGQIVVPTPTIATPR